MQLVLVHGFGAAHWCQTSNDDDVVVVVVVVLCHYWHKSTNLTTVLLLARVVRPCLRIDLKKEGF